MLDSRSVQLAREPLSESERARARVSGSCGSDVLPAFQIYLQWGDGCWTWSSRRRRPVRAIAGGSQLGISEGRLSGTCLSQRPPAAAEGAAALSPSHSLVSSRGLRL